MVVNLVMAVNLVMVVYWVMPDGCELGDGRVFSDHQ